jgi:uncharacterized protein (TIGR02246 family)
MTRTRETTGTAEEQITRAIEDFEEGWNRRDLAAACAGFAEDADFVSVTGRWWRGRPEIVARLEELRGTTLRITSVSIRFLTFDVVVVHLTWQLRGKGAAVRRGILTLATRRQKTRWIVDAAQNTELTD